MTTKISMSTKIKTIGAAILLLAIGCKGPAKKDEGPKNLSVITVSTTQADVSETIPATLKGKQDIEIRPKVSGYITELCVDEGSVVHKGQVLFKLDQVSYREAVAAAEASVRAIEANVNSQELAVENKKLLAQRNVISDMELKSAEYSLKAVQGQLAQAKAQLSSAKKDLSFTYVSSPSDGIVGSIPYRVGSLVSSTMTTPLTTVSDISDIYAYFSIDEKQLLEYTKSANGASINDVAKKMPKVKLLLADGSQYDQAGTIETISGVINSATGSVTLRAKFANKGRVLRSGASGNIVLPNHISSAIIIPQRATYDIQNKRFVYVVSDSSTVVSTPIEAIDAGDGQQFIVTSGIKAGDRIVVEGIIALKDGMKINVKK